MRPLLAESLLLALSLFALAGDAGARESDRQQSIELRAQGFDGSLAEDGDSTFTGNVAITQGTLAIGAARMVITRAKGEVARIRFQGQPATMQQQNDNGALMRAAAEKIDYDVTAEIVTLSGNVVVNQDGNDLRGQNIVYNLKDERLNASGADSGEGRIQMTLKPRTKAAPETPAAPEKSGEDKDASP